jgi:selenide,water dikinase
VLASLSFPADERVLVGLETSDDAGVFRISADTALVQTVDF